jgi:hypothetical protein
MFSRSIITQPVALHTSDFAYGSEKELIVYKLEKANYGMCIHEGFVRPDSIRLISYSAGECNGAFIQYTTEFECDICTLYEGMVLSKCVVTEVYASAGIVAEVYLPNIDPPVSFIRVYVHRDTHLDQTEQLERISEKDMIDVVVTGVRFQKGSRQMEATCQLYK